MVEAGSSSFNSTPSLGTSICCRRGRKKPKKKKKRERKNQCKNPKQVAAGRTQQPPKTMKPPASPPLAGPWGAGLRGNPRDLVSNHQGPAEALGGAGGGTRVGGGFGLAASALRGLILPRRVVAPAGTSLQLPALTCPKGCSSCGLWLQVPVPFT